MSLRRLPGSNMPSYYVIIILCYYYLYYYYLLFIIIFICILVYMYTYNRVTSICIDLSKIIRYSLFV